MALRLLSSNVKFFLRKPQLGIEFEKKQNSATFELINLSPMMNKTLSTLLSENTGNLLKIGGQRLRSLNKQISD